MNMRGPITVLVLMAAGFLLGGLATIGIPVGHGISGFWVAGVVQVVGSVWFGGWGVLAGALFPILSNAVAHLGPSAVLGFIPANLVNGLIAAWAFRYFRVDPAIPGRRGLGFYLLWCGLVPALAGGLLSSTALVLFHEAAWRDLLAIEMRWALPNLLVSLFGILILRELTPLCRDLGILVQGWWDFAPASKRSLIRRFQDMPVQLKLVLAMCAAGAGPLVVLSLLELIRNGGRSIPGNLNPLFLTISLVTLVLAVGFLSREMVQPLRDLREQIDHLLRHQEGALAIDRMDELGELARAFSFLLEDWRRSAGLLQDREEQLRLIMDSTGEAIHGIGMDGLCTFANRSCVRLLGYQHASDLVGKNMHLVAHSRTADGAPLPQDQCRISQAFQQGTGVTNTDEYFWRKDGTGFPVDFSSYPIRKDGRHMGAVVVWRDISERRQAERQQAQLQAQLQQAQKMESLGSLAGGVAHDMNNVLGAILAMAEANLEEHPADSGTARAFDTIAKAATRGGKMVKSLLTFARQSPAEEHQLDLNTLILENVQLLEGTTLFRIGLELELAPDLRPILGDGTALTHALMNLCVNAVDALGEAGTLTLRTLNLEPGWIEVQVADTGAGMAKEVLQKAVEPFFTTKPVGKGTGLGLAMVYSTVKAHRGEMEILSEPGRGTCVKVRLPACALPAEASPAPAEPRATAASGGLNLLLVDDDELIRFSTQALVQGLGHRATVVASGEEALLQLEAGLAPDVVILDMNMPGLGGAGTLPRLRALRPNLPVLLITGRADQAVMDFVEGQSRVTVLFKPFGKKDLKKQLEPFG